MAEAINLGLDALALTDHDGFYGAPVFAEAAAGSGLRTVYGAELSIGLPGPQAGVADPVGDHLLVLAGGLGGYRRLASAITEGHLAAGGEKGRPIFQLEDLAATGAGEWVVLSGCRKGLVRRALEQDGSPAAAAALDRLVGLFGRDRVLVELIDHQYPTDTETNDALAALAAKSGLRTVATGNVHYATPEETRLAAAVAAVRARRSLTDMDGWLPPPTAFLRSGTEMAQLFARYPGAVATTVDVAKEISFDLAKARPRLPKLDVPDGHTPHSWLTQLAREGADRLYPDPAGHAAALRRLDQELTVIEAKDFAGYFLIVHEIVEFARQRGILCQGRGSAAASLVCFAMGITAIDVMAFRLPFERFLSVTRDEEPDIDVDFDSDRREEVIQHVYARYGRRCAAQVANVISYRPRSAVRDMAKALGYSTGQQDAWSKQLDAWQGSINTVEGDHQIPGQVVDLANQLMRAPRHLGIHPCGMVLTREPVSQICPVEPGRMEGRTVLQWDKDACAYMGLVKFDLLGLGILSAISHTLQLVAEHLGEQWTLQSIPKEEAGVYDMLCRADSIGVFQVESRAQIGTLPRLRPRCFYDLTIEVGLIRPGPIQGGAVHPYIRRANGREEVTYLHPALEPVLQRTRGIPLFQEQLMQIATTVGDLTGGEADLLRRAMGSKRGVEKIERLKDKLYEGMRAHDITGEVADQIYARIEAFASFGFAESHALSFALLVYASSWLKLHYPAAFLTGLLRAQPMGFYSPQSLVADARHHGIETRRPDIACSAVDATLEAVDPDQPIRPGGLPGCLERVQPPVPPFDPDGPDPTRTHRRDQSLAVRLGLSSVDGLGAEAAQRIVAARAERPFASIADLIARAELTRRQAEQLASAGALHTFGYDRRQAIWMAGYPARADQLDVTLDAAPPALPAMTGPEQTAADLQTIRIAPDAHPFAHHRPVLREHGIRPIASIGRGLDRRRITVAGHITHRQRPSTAGGVTFLNLEDETGMLNIVCSTPLWQRYRRVLRGSNSLVIRGLVEWGDGALNLIADKVGPLADLLPTATITPASSRDFR